MQGTPVWQTVPHEPQLSRSLTMSMQVPPQKSWPEAQRFTHMHDAPSNSWFAAHEVDTHVPLEAQSVSPAPQLVAVSH